MLTGTFEVLLAFSEFFPAIIYEFKIWRKQQNESARINTFGGHFLTCYALPYTQFQIKERCCFVGLLNNLSHTSRNIPWLKDNAA